MGGKNYSDEETAKQDHLPLLSQQSAYRWMKVAAALWFALGIIGYLRVDFLAASAWGVAPILVWCGDRLLAAGIYFAVIFTSICLWIFPKGFRYIVFVFAAALSAMDIFTSFLLVQDYGFKKIGCLGMIVTICPVLIVVYLGISIAQTRKSVRGPSKT